MSANVEELLVVEGRFSVKLVDKLVNAITEKQSVEEIFRISKMLSTSEVNMIYNGKHPIAFAVERGNIEIVKMLLQIPGIDVNLRDYFLSLIHI